MQAEVSVFNFMMLMVLLLMNDVLLLCLDNCQPFFLTLLASALRYQRRPHSFEPWTSEHHATSRPARNLCSGYKLSSRHNHEPLVYQRL